MKAVREIVADYLRSVGADGLCHRAECCGCGLDDLMPCVDGGIACCVPARKIPFHTIDEDFDDVDWSYEPMDEEAGR